MKKILILVLLFGIMPCCFAYDSDGLKMRDVVANIEESEYRYQIGEFNPPIEIKYFEDGRIHNETPMDALISVYTQMKYKNWDGFRKIWKDFDEINQFILQKYNIKPESKEWYFEAWGLSLTNPNYIKFRADYKDLIIYVVEFKNVNGDIQRIATPIKKFGDLFYQVNFEIISDKLVSALDWLKFDPMTGKFIE